jgi:6-pyruvoyltetrahydropterin/6-carboxytetrahydropterin synthase
MMRLKREFTFDSAHSIADMGRCERLHGHTYRLVVTLEGTPNENGIILDFRRLNEIVSSNVLSLLDHQHLNSLIENPTTENVVRWIADRLSPVLRGENFRLVEVELFESPMTSVAYNLTDERSTEGA